MLAEVEENLINGFVVNRKRERYVTFLRSPKRRREFLRQLYHFHDFEPAFMVPFAPAHESADRLVAELQRYGAPDSCYVISVDPNLDGITDRLSAIIPRVYARIEGTIVSCIPGRLAYYEGEPPDNRFILTRTPQRTRR